MQHLSNVKEQQEQGELKAAVNLYPSPYDHIETEVEIFKGLHSSTAAVWQNFEKPLRCRISRDDWLRVRADLSLDNENEDHFPRYSYDT